ncbi:MAG: FAD-binding oxidoreductase [Bacteroidetes bacterium]|nr:FAD-binding oxidoreductase [Bacteroidota bacterium]
MQVDYLIIGQGISGTWLSYYLLKEGKSVLVIDDAQTNTPSRIAAGIINPVTGRRHVTVWMAETILPFALDAYSQIGQQLGIPAISQKTITDFFPSAQMRLSFLQRAEEDNTYVRMPQDESVFQEQFHYELGYGQVMPAYTVHLETLLPAWRKHLLSQQSLLEEKFNLSQLQIKNDAVQYNHIHASRIIFCDGASSAQSVYFNRLPFAPNKGEALTLEIPDLSPNYIYKKGLMLTPLATPGQWWIGSNYAWEFENDEPTEAFRSQATTLLKNWLKVPYRIHQHLSGIRPATLERRPFVGMHPLYPSVGILNGMGTKGCSLAPYFAYQLACLLEHDEPVYPEASLSRFERILSR